MDILDIRCTFGRHFYFTNEMPVLQESMMTILAMVNADKEGQIESKMMKARQMEEIREARRKEAEARQEVKRTKLVCLSSKTGAGLPLTIVGGHEGLYTTEAKAANRFGSGRADCFSPTETI